ncbi:MAG: phosphopyruvate hydratase [Candidatus Gracilibacteria bacterium]|nr:phosphopyruvate hydratase [Candidatus Gracilibacteria bacterium]
MAIITNLKARQVLDSRGNPTVEVEIFSENHKGWAIVPSGASTGAYEAVEIRDGGEKWMGKGVFKAVSHVNEEIFEAVKGMELGKQRELDDKLIALDGTENKGRLGANALLGVSLAYARLSAMEAGKKFYEYLQEISGTDHMTLPRPMMNVINGGEHADNTLDIQEFMLFPKAETFSENLRIGAEVFHHLKTLLQERNLSTAVGDEGGFAPNLRTHEEALSLMSEATERAGHTDMMEYALDCAASEFYDPESKMYMIEAEETSAEKLIDYYAYLSEKYPIVSIEDPLHEDDWEHWREITEKLGDKMQIVGDDLLVTNVKKLEKAIDQKSCNAILIKFNQIGTLSETIDAIQMAQKAGMNAVTSHRSGETEDTSIADLAVGLNTGQIKTGSLSRTDRIAKYNQLLRIEEEL